MAYYTALHPSKIDLVRTEKMGSILRVNAKMDKSIDGEQKCGKSSLNHLVRKIAKNASLDAVRSVSRSSSTTEQGSNGTPSGKRKKSGRGNSTQKGRKDEMQSGRLFCI